MSLINLLVFTFNIILLADSCSVLEKTQNDQKLDAFAESVSSGIIPMIDTCVFGDGNFANYLGISSYLTTDDAMISASTAFVDASLTIED